MRRALCLLPLLGSLFIPALAEAQTPVRVQGTTDTTDSGLITDVIQPGFEAAFPQYKLQYIAVGTGQALTNARNGQADAVLTHAPTSEAAFVNDGFAFEPVGRAIFYNDYVLIGHNRDPAAVQAGANHDAIRAMELIAAAGAAGQAIWVSRGDNSGTHVQEGLMWGMTNVPTHPLGAGRFEPDGNGDGMGTDIPSWYKKAGVGQAATVQVTTQCNFGDPRDRCYSMTDRGTYDRQTQIGAITDMKVVTEKNDAAARGGQTLLLNPFHVYAVNPAKFSSVNLPGALAFMDYLTSPALQDRLLSYPTAANPRFFPDAFPDPTFLKPRLPRRVDGGKTITVKGILANRFPGAGAVNGATLILQQSNGTWSKQFTDLKHATTDANGAFTLVAHPSRSGVIRVSFPRFADLSPTTFTVGKVLVREAVRLRAPWRLSNHRLRIRGSVNPGAAGGTARIEVLARERGAKGGLRRIAATHPRKGQRRYGLTVRVTPGTWQFKVRYRHPGVVDTGTSRARSVTVR